MADIKSRKEVLIIIPAYNEAKTIEPVLLSLMEPEIFSVCDILVMNDASKDGTQYIVKKHGLNCVTHIFNLGYGSGLQVGYKYARRRGYKYVIQMDADGQHDPSNVLRIYEALKTADEDGNYPDIVIGSRFVEGTTGFRSYFMRRVGIRFFRFLIATVTGHSITDATSGFRAYGHEALLFAAENYPSFDYPEPEECILFLRNGFRVVEVPCNMLERQGGRSSIRSLKAAYYMLKVSFAMIMESFRPRIRKGI